MYIDHRLVSAMISACFTAIFFGLAFVFLFDIGDVQQIENKTVSKTVGAFIFLLGSVFAFFAYYLFKGWLWHVDNNTPEQNGAFLRAVMKMSDSEARLLEGLLAKDPKLAADMLNVIEKRPDKIKSEPEKNE